MSHPMSPFESADTNDDDGNVIDSLFIETDNPPEPAIEPILIKALVEPTPITRILGQDTLIPPSSDVRMLLPADKNRKSLNIYVYSPTAVTTDGVRISDDNGMCLTGSKLLHGGTIDLLGHTGPLYVTSCSASSNTASATVSIQYWSVSS